MGNALALSLLLTLAAAAERPLMRDFIGLNVHTVLFKPDLYAPVTRQLRNYHPVVWDLGEDPGAAAIFPSARNGVDWGKLYGDWRDRGYTTNAALQVESLAADKWRDPAAQGYAYGKSFAEAFGPSGARRSVASVEIGNEPVAFSDASYRALFEAMAKGVRAGDPKMRILPCAVALGSADKFSRDVAALNGLGHLYDALNIHVYSFKEHWPRWTRSYPEDPGTDYLARVRAMLKWRDEHAIRKPVWVTEFGWDASTRKPPPTGEGGEFVQNSDLQQAQYLVRSLLVFSAMDVGKAFVFFFNDDDAPSLHAASGITRKYAPKPSFHALAQLQRVLGDYRFHAKVQEVDGKVYAYEYQAPGRESVIVAWSPTGSGRTAEARLNLGKRRVVRTERMAVREGAPDVALVGKLPGRSGRFAASESPTYLWVR